LAKVTHAQESNKYFAFKGHYYISFYGGGADILGKLGDQNFPVINPSIGYHISDRFSIVADGILYTSGPGKVETNKSSFEFNKASHYGVAVRYFTRRNLKCGTATFQTGVYLFDTDTDKSTVNWLFTPGWLYPLHKKEKLFVEMAGDFQMNELVRGRAFLMTGKLGLSYHF
jgi:hypothetical protein